MNPYPKFCDVCGTLRAWEGESCDCAKQALERQRANDEAKRFADAMAAHFTQENDARA